MGRSVFAGLPTREDIRSLSVYSPFQPWAASSPYGLALGLAALLCVILAALALRHRSLPGALEFVALMAGLAFWALFYSWELTTPSLEGKLVWLRLEFIGSAVAPVGWFLFARAYSGRSGKMGWRYLSLVCLVPLITVLMVATNGLHGLVWSQASVVNPGKVAGLFLQAGPWYWVNVANSYALLIAGSAFLLAVAFRQPQLYRSQMWLLVIGTATPWASNIVTVIWLRGGWLDITPFAFIITGVLLFLAITRAHLFTRLPALLPLAGRRMLESMVDAVLVLDAGSVVVTANPVAAAILDQDGKGLVGMPVAALLAGWVPDARAIADGREHRFEIRLNGAEGPRVFDVSTSPLKLGRAGAGSLLVLRDMTERDRTEAALRESEERFRAVFDQGSFGIALTDDEQVFVRANPVFCAMLGYEESELLGLSVLDVTAPADAVRSREVFGRLRAGGAPVVQLEKQYVRKDGSTLWAQTSVGSLRWAEGRPAGTVAVIQDITERRRQAEALGMSQAQLEAATDLADLAYWELDLDTGMFTFNDRFYALYGTTAEAEGGYHMPADVYAQKFVSPEDAHLVAAEVRRAVDSDDPGMRAYVEHDIIRADGEVRNIVVRYGITKDEHGRTIRTQGANQDVTVRKRTEQALSRAEEHLKQAQKMEAVGQLAGGIAHDFNNLLTAIMGNSDLALEAMEPEDPNRPFVEDIREVTERAAGLTKQILAFSRRQMLKPEVVRLNDIVISMEPLLHRTITEKIVVETMLDPDLKLIEVDPHQMEQVIMNLAVNARDAMPDGGRLTVATANVSLDRVVSREDADLEPGDYVLLSARDTGEGMDQATISRIFEPFFTTKELGKGTGLGLSTVFGIVRQSGGIIDVESTVGAGSTFKVYLPLCKEQKMTGAERSSKREALTGTETILVVEDERPVRELVVRVLARAGYATFAAGSADEVDVLMAAEHPAIDLLLTDVVLPGGRGGPDVAASIRARHDRLPVVFMPGYTQDASVFAGGNENAEFLEKPFETEGLLAVVRALLDARAAEKLRVTVLPPQDPALN